MMQGLSPASDQIDIVINHFLFSRHQKNIHLIGVGFAFPQNLEIKIDVTDIKGDVLLGFEMNGFLQLFFCHGLRALFNGSVSNVNATNILKRAAPFGFFDFSYLYGPGADIQADKVIFFSKAMRDV